MKSAVTIEDVGVIEDPYQDIFNIYQAYADTVLTDPKRQEETSGRQGHFHPSALSMCARMNVYTARNEPFRLHYGVQDYEIFEIGHAVHNRIQSVLEEVEAFAKRNGLIWSIQNEAPCPEEDELFDELLTGGTTDVLLEIEKPGEWKQRGVVEIKSMKDEYWQKLKKPKKENLLQAHLYAFRWDTPIIWVWYYNKNNSMHRVFPTTFSEELFGEAVQRLEMFNEHLAAGTLPDREESWYSCQRCGYLDACNPKIVKPRVQTYRKPAKTKTKVRSFKRKAR